MRLRQGHGSHRPGEGRVYRGYGDPVPSVLPGNSGCLVAVPEREDQRSRVLPEDEESREAGMSAYQVHSTDGRGVKHAERWTNSKDHAFSVAYEALGKDDVWKVEIEKEENERA
jgi:hypothetical protein